MVKCSRSLRKFPKIPYQFQCSARREHVPGPPLLLQHGQLMRDTEESREEVECREEVKAQGSTGKRVGTAIVLETCRLGQKLVQSLTSRQ